ncbi:Lrp/AsnC family transcriptional regulator [Candidatus Micrarchaeota archaeon]|nr:Lrp/AsnC family transcriptional regulator [Candidatus Micrarchaeota archaeon]
MLLLMDEKDERILDVLEGNSRLSTAGISRKTRIPRVTVHERIQKLKQSGVIEKFTVKLDRGKMGLPSTAFVLVSYSHNQKQNQRKLAKQIALLARVKEVHIIGGEWDLLVKIVGPSIEEIGRVVVDKIREFEGVGKTMTISSWEKAKEEL